MKNNHQLHAGPLPKFLEVFVNQLQTEPLPKFGGSRIILICMWPLENSASSIFLLHIFYSLKLKTRKMSIVLKL